MIEARYYEKKEEGKVHCHLCPHNCLIAPGKKGICRMRENQGGTLYSLIYGKVSAANNDPIEKKPLYHFYPGTEIFSLGSIGCNFRCPWCQNWHLVEGKVSTSDLSPEEAVRLALKHKSIGIAYTYNEPSIWVEYVYDTSLLAREKGLKNVLVTNGFFSPAPLRDLLPFIDAMNIDLKSFREATYTKHSHGGLAPVLETIKTSARATHVEITTLLIPGVNDSREELEEMVEFIASVNRAIPLHFSRYFPQYRFSAPATPPEKLLEAYEIAKKKLLYVYLGNVAAAEKANTYCPQCKQLLIERVNYFTKIVGMKNGNCFQCGEKIQGVFAVGHGNEHRKEVKDMPEEKDLNEGVNKAADPKNPTDLEKKHLPIIDAPSSVKADTPFEVTVHVGKLLTHPNELAHHIQWLDLYAERTFLNRAELTAVKTEPKVTFTLKLKKSTNLRAYERCNIHGVWEWDLPISVT